MTALARRLDDSLWLLDTFFQNEPGVIACYLTAGSDGLALVDVGPTTTIHTLLDGVRAAGFDPEQLTRFIVTHVHLDHAGAAGTLLGLFPHVEVVAHRRAAEHLLDPTRLVRSATRIYGERMETLWGEALPVPPERLRVVDDGDRVAIGRGALRVLYTPGHASHHIALFDERRGVLFAGDVAGVRLEDPPIVRPPTPPPDLSLELWYESLERLNALAPRRLLLPHFGPVDDVAAHLAVLRDRLRAWGELAVDGMRSGADAGAIAQTFASTEASRNPALRQPATARKFELTANYLMSAQGYMRYLQTQRPDLLE